MNKDEKPMLISRSFKEFRADEKDEVGHLVGVPIVFNSPTDIGGMFEETIERGAIDEKVLNDVAFFFNHDINTSKALARTRTKKLRFEIKEDGVHMEADVNLKRTDAKDLFIAIQDGDINEMSFMFMVTEDDWQDLDTDYPKRTIKKIGYVQEVSACNWGAYSSTSINARTNRSLDNDLKTLENVRASKLDNVEKTELDYETKVLLTILK